VSVEFSTDPDTDENSEYGLAVLVAAAILVA